MVILLLSIVVNTIHATFAEIDGGRIVLSSQAATSDFLHGFVSIPGPGSRSEALGSRRSSSCWQPNTWRSPAESTMELLRIISCVQAATSCHGGYQYPPPNEPLASRS